MIYSSKKYSPWAQWCSFLYLQLVLFGSCTLPGHVANTFEYNKEQIRKEVAEAVESFRVADTSLNAQAMIDLLWPEYTMLADGHRIKYEDVVSSAPAFMDGLRLFHTTWSDVDIIPISNDAALSSFIFRDSIITKEGQLTRARGPNTFLWQRRNGEWRVLYGDADHYPIQDKSQFVRED